MDVENLMGEVRSLTSAPSPRNFATLMSVLRESSAEGPRLRDEVFPYIHEALSSWPATVARVVADPEREWFREMCRTTDAYRWTYPIDLSCVPFEEQAWQRAAAALGIDEGSRVFSHGKWLPNVDELYESEFFFSSSSEEERMFTALVRACLEREYGIEPVQLECTADDFWELSSHSHGDYINSEGRGARLAFVGDITVKGDMKAEGRLLSLMVYGDLEVKGRFVVTGFDHFLYVGGDLSAHVMHAETFPLFVEETLDASFADLNAYSGDWLMTINRVGGGIIAVHGTYVDVRTDGAKSLQASYTRARELTLDALRDVLSDDALQAVERGVSEQEGVEQPPYATGCSSTSPNSSSLSRAEHGDEPSPRAHPHVSSSSVAWNRGERSAAQSEGALKNACARKSWV